MPITINGLTFTPSEGSGEGAITIATNEVNDGVDRVTTVYLQSYDPATGNKLSLKKPFTIVHLGQREIFNGSNTEFMLNDGGTFNVLKE